VTTSWLGQNEGNGPVGLRGCPLRSRVVGAVLFATHPRFRDHDTGPGHPERPARLGAVVDGLVEAGLDDAIVRVEPRPATRAELEAVHPADHLDRIEALCRSGGGAIDADTHVSAQSWDVALLAAGAGVDAAERLERGEGDAAFCAVRPPGHHATRDRSMGFCLLNNGAVTAAHLADRGERVLVVDIDAHHGNGTQAIFYERSDVFTTSVHVDPGAGWFPHHVGFADETGRDAGHGANLNQPLAPGTGDQGWLSAVERAGDAVTAHGATALVIALGVDAAIDDPESPLQVTVEAYRQAGNVLAALGLPTVVVQEGGYHLPTLGRLVGAALDGLG
jgi:acetoin utilization deacetylase AcuC-like enzyme